MTTAREALRAFLEKQPPATQSDYDIVASGAPEVPNLTDPDHRVKAVLDLRTSPAYPPFTSGFVFLPDPRDGGEAQAIHDEFVALNAAALQERSDEADGNAG